MWSLSHSRMSELREKGAYALSTRSILSYMHMEYGIMICSWPLGSNTPIPIREYEGTIMLHSVHATNHGSIICIADLNCLQNVIMTGETLEPDDMVELDFASFVEFI